MTTRTTTVLAAAALVILGQAAVAKEPMQLNLDQMDQITAGSIFLVYGWDDPYFNSTPLPVFSLSNSQMQADDYSD